MFSLWRVSGFIRSPYPSSWTPNFLACVCLCVCVFVFVFVACMWVQPLALLVRSSVSPNRVIFIHEWRNKAACPPLSSCPSTIIHHSYDKYGRTDLCLNNDIIIITYVLERNCMDSNYLQVVLTFRTFFNFMALLYEVDRKSACIISVVSSIIF